VEFGLHVAGNGTNRATTLPLYVLLYVLFEILSVALGDIFIKRLSNI
jgi:hypothetical protein